MSKKKKRAKTCNWPKCQEKLTIQPGRGRPHKYCDEHKVADKKRRNALRDQRIILTAIDLAMMQPCCRDARLANTRVRGCIQHREWRQFVKRCRRDFARSYNLYTRKVRQPSLERMLTTGQRGWGVIDLSRKKRKHVRPIR